ncbi:MAG: substrate-binding domain-containing protein [Planctomycetota bacterium]
MCFCDEFACNVMSPNLSFIDLQSQRMGRVAARELEKMIERPNEINSKDVNLKEKLVVRKSTTSLKN